MIITCTIGQIAIFVKKFIEHQKDKIPVASINPNEGNSPVSNTLVANNKRWNEYLCNNTGLFTILIFLALMVTFLHFGLGEYIFMKNLYEEDQRLLRYHFNGLIMNVFIPVCIYAMNDKLFNHVKTEILEFKK